MKKLLIVGAGQDQLDAIKIARKRGVYVIAIDYNKNAIGAKYADKFYPISTRDFNSTLNMAKKEKINGILTLISESAVVNVAKVAEVLHLPCYSVESAIAATNKIKMHELMISKNVTMPKSVSAFSYNELEEKTTYFEYPIVIKPSDSSGQRGIYMLKDKRNLKEAFENAKKIATDERVIIDEFIQGPEINVCTVVINSKVHVLSLSNRVILKEPCFGIAVQHLCPATIPDKILTEVEEMAIRATEALELNNGITYPQIIIRDKKPYLIEIAVRIPGGNMREIARYYSGIDMVDVAISQALSEQKGYSDFIATQSSKGVVVKHISDLNVPENVDIIEKISGKEKFVDDTNVRNIDFRYSIGDKIESLQWSGNRFASIITTGPDLISAFIKSQDVFNNIKINNKDLIDYNTSEIQNYKEIYSPILNES